MRQRMPVTEGDVYTTKRLRIRTSTGNFNRLNVTSNSSMTLSHELPMEDMIRGKIALETRTPLTLERTEINDERVRIRRGPFGIFGSIVFSFNEN